MRHVSVLSPQEGHGDIEAISTIAARCLQLELETWPKPGLVSPVDNGSHDDMTAASFTRSIAAIVPFLSALAHAGARGANMVALRRIGMQAERAMLAATAGVNTHRGAIFGLGLLCAAAGRRRADAARRDDVSLSTPTLGAVVRDIWGDDILAGPRAADSHGEIVARRYGAKGARYEAANGFEAIYRIGLPALCEAERLRPGDADAARVHACFSLIAALVDTNLLHRGGEDGLRFAQARARDFLARGGIGAEDWLAHAEDCHRAFVLRRLSPGGAADLLAMTLFVSAVDERSES